MDHEISAPSGSPAPSTSAQERQARAEWLVAELHRRAASCSDPREQANLRRSADSLVRLAAAYRS